MIDEQLRSILEYVYDHQRCLISSVLQHFSHVHNALEALQLLYDQKFISARAVDTAEKDIGPPFPAFPNNGDAFLITTTAGNIQVEEYRTAEKRWNIPVKISIVAVIISIISLIVSACSIFF